MQIFLHYIYSDFTRNNFKKTLLAEAVNPKMCHLKYNDGKLTQNS